MKKLMSLLLAAAMLLSLTVCTQAETANPYYEEGFSQDFESEDFSLGSTANDYGFQRNLTGVRAENPDGDGMVYQISEKDPEDSAYARFFLTGSNRFDANYMTVSFDARISGVAADYEGDVFGIYFGNDKNDLVSGSTWYGPTIYGTKTSDVETIRLSSRASLAQDTWYSLKFYFDMVGRRCRIYYKDIKFGTDYKIVGDTPIKDVNQFLNIGQLEFGLKSQDVSICIDNIKLEKNLFDNESAEAVILAPSRYSDMGENPTLKAYVKDADNVKFYINNKLVKEFTSPAADNTYEFTSNDTTVGTKKFDVVYTKGSEIKMVTGDYEHNGTVDRYKDENDPSRAFEVSKHAQNVMVAEEQADGSTYYHFSAPRNSNSYIYHVCDSDTGLIGGRFCMETDMKVNTTCDWIWFDIGVNAKGDATTDISKGYISDATPKFSFVGNGNVCLFESDGTIAKTSTTYQKDTWMHLKYVIDFNKQQSELYVDGSNVKTQKFNDAYLAYSNAKIFSKFRLCYQNSKSTWDQLGFYLKNTKFYNEGESSMPALNSISYDESVAANKVVPASANKIDFVFDKAFDASTITDSNVKVLFDGAEAAGSISSVDGKTITFIPENTLPMNKKASLEISTNVQICGNNIPNKYDIAFYIGSENGLHMSAFEEGNVLAYYIVAGEASQSVQMILAEYSSDKMTKLDNVWLSKVSLSKGGSGVVSVVKPTSQYNKLLFWNDTFQAFTLPQTIEK